MAVYSVHLPGAGAAQGQKSDPANAAFVREGFSWPAFLFGPFWLLARRLWLWAALWLAAFLALTSTAGAGVVSSGATVTLVFLAQLLLGLEAGGLIEKQLWRRGYDLAEIVAAPHLEEAEMAFYRQSGTDETPAVAPQRLAAPPHVPATSPGPPPVIGSFPAPGA